MYITKIKQISKNPAYFRKSFLIFDNYDLNTAGKIAQKSYLAVGIYTANFQCCATF